MRLSSVVGRRSVGLAGEGEEGVVEGRAAQGDLVDGDAGVARRRRRRAARSTISSGAGIETMRRSRATVSVERGRRARRRARSSPAASTATTSTRCSPIWDLSSLGRAGGDGPAVVDQHDAVGQHVGLVEVLGGEQQGDALGDEVADGRPHDLAAAGVEAGGGLVEHEQLGLDDEAGGQVDPAALAAGDVLHQLVAELADVEAVDEAVDDRGGGRVAVAAQAGHQHEVLAGGEVVLEGGELAGERDAAAHGVGLA